MQANDLKNKNKKKKKCIGRGGKKGTYSGRGMKGQKSRSGFSQRATFEGGKSSLVMHTKKKKGFKALNAKVETVSLDKIDKNFSNGDTIDKSILKEKNLIKKVKNKVKILSDGVLTKKIIVNSDIFTSKIAKDKILKAGGEIVKSK